MEFTAELAKAQYNNSKAKSLIYQTDSRTVTPQQTNNRSKLRRQKQEVPYAVQEENKEELYPQVFHKIIVNKNVHEKVGTGRDFDPKVYAQNLQQLQETKSNSKLRNFNGSGKILQHVGAEKNGLCSVGNDVGEGEVGQETGAVFG